MIRNISQHINYYLYSILIGLVGCGIKGSPLPPLIPTIQDNGKPYSSELSKKYNQKDAQIAPEGTILEISPKKMPQ